MSMAGREGVGPDKVEATPRTEQAVPAPLTTHHSRLTSTHLAAAAFLAFVFFYISHDKVWHTDVWAHLRFGEYVLKEGRLPQRETFSGDFVDQEQPYLNFQWLAQTAGYFVYELGARLAGGDAERQLAGG